jgi:hypothetical protein
MRIKIPTQSDQAKKRTVYEKSDSEPLDQFIRIDVLGFKRRPPL